MLIRPFALSEAQVYLHVPYDEKEDAKKEGCKFCSYAKTWYCDVSNTKAIGLWGPSTTMKTEKEKAFNLKLKTKLSKYVGDNFNYFTLADEKTVGFIPKGECAL